MAKQTGLFKFTGKLDNVIGYRRNGTHFVRSMPEKVRQTPATRRAARNFGIASRKGKLIRRAVTPYLDRHDGALVNRLNKALVQAGGNLRAIEGFRFNAYTATDKFFILPPVFTAAGVLKIPAQELSALGGATHLEVSVIAARINFAERRIVEVETATEVIDLDKPFNGIELAARAGGKGTLIVTLYVQACTECNGRLLPMRNRKYVAADIVCVAPPAVSAGSSFPVFKKQQSQTRSSLPVIRRSCKAACAGRRSNLLPYRAIQTAAAETNALISSRHYEELQDSVRGATKQSPAIQGYTDSGSRDKRAHPSASLRGAARAACAGRRSNLLNNTTAGRRHCRRLLRPPGRLE